jgi:hypothetical protein
MFLVVSVVTSRTTFGDVEDYMFCLRDEQHEEYCRFGRVEEMKDKTSFIACT